MVAHPSEQTNGFDDLLAVSSAGTQLPEDLGLFPKALEIVPKGNSFVTSSSFGASGRAQALTWRHVLAADVLALMSATAVGIALRPAVGSTLQNGPVLNALLVTCLFGVAQLTSFGSLGLYRKGAVRLQPTSHSDFGRIICGVSVAAFVSGLLITLLHWRNDAAALDEVRLVIVVALASLMLTLLGRSITYLVVGSRHPSRVLVIGSGMVAEQVSEYLSRGHGTEVVGFVDDDPAPSTIVLGKVSDVPSLCERFDVDRIIVTFTRLHPEELNDALRGIRGTVPIGVVPRFFELMTWRSEVGDLCGLPIVDIAAPSLSSLERAVKRTFDVVVSSLLLVLLFPVLLLVGVAIKCTSKGPVMFSQPRTGRWGKQFTMYKFRTMQLDADDLKSGLEEFNETAGPLFKMRADPRTTRVGSLLRRWSLDELPQLLNVLRGTMSLVGPRPFVPGESEKIDGWARRRFEVRPGLTGLWQVSGRSDLSYDDLQRLDYTYVASWSLAWDLKILWQTPGCVLRSLGAY